MRRLKKEEVTQCHSQDRFGIGPFTSTPTNTTVGPIGNKLPGEKHASFNTSTKSLKALATQSNLFAKEAHPTAEAEASPSPAPAQMPFAPQFVPSYVPMPPQFGYNPAFSAYPIVLPSTVTPASAQAVPAALATRQIPFLPIQV
ncbi:MAG: hypothetical protein ACP5MT_03130 [Candidatus Acidifodinimicrobium sp.]